MFFTQKRDSVCVCVCARERERERDGDSDTAFLCARLCKVGYRSLPEPGGIGVHRKMVTLK